MTIVAIRTGLFPDSPTVDAALACLQPAVRVIDVSRDSRSEAQWDEVLAAVLDADRVLSF